MQFNSGASKDFEIKNTVCKISYGTYSPQHSMDKICYLNTCVTRTYYNKTYIPHVMALLDQVPLLWQNLASMVVFSSSKLALSQTKQALEPGVVPL